MRNVFKTWRWGLIHVLTVVAIIAVLLAILLEPVKWASDGDLRLPVQVLVFDAVNCRPIANAQCLVYRSPPVLDASSLRDTCPQSGSINDWPAESRSVTDATGTSIIEHKFDTSASYKNPITHAHLRSAWVRVEAVGYGGVVVPVRHKGRPTSELRKEGVLFVSIGLIPISEHL